MVYAHVSYQCTHARVHVRAHACMCARLRLYVCMGACTWVCIHVRVCEHVCANAPWLVTATTDGNHGTMELMQTLDHAASIVIRYTNARRYVGNATPDHRTVLETCLTGSGESQIQASTIPALFGDARSAVVHGLQHVDNYMTGRRLLRQLHQHDVGHRKRYNTTGFYTYLNPIFVLRRSDQVTITPAVINTTRAMTLGAIASYIVMLTMHAGMQTSNVSETFTIVPCHTLLHFDVYY